MAAMAVLTKLRTANLLAVSRWVRHRREARSRSKRSSGGNCPEAMEDTCSSEPSSSLGQVNDQDDSGNYEQEVDESATNVAIKASKIRADKEALLTE
jgi:hypothetical protein